MFNENSLQDWVLAVLSSKISLTADRVNLILSFYPTLSESILDNFSKLKKTENKWLNRFQSSFNLEKETLEFKTKLEKSEIQFITIFSPNFPKKLQILQKVPVVLFYEGDLKLLETNSWITVVGARNSSLYAENLMKLILEPCCISGLGVVSGLAMGVDKISHETALKMGSKTIGVIGSGLDKDCFYPSQNWLLKNQIVKGGGLVLSEYGPGSVATVYNFPARNRILAAISELTWVVQAGLKSGSLITAEAARDLSKTVATTPGSILDKSLLGNLELIKNGASLISSPEDIFQLLGLKTHPEILPRPKPVFDNSLEENVYNSLDLNAINIEKIATKLNLKITDLASILSLLELRGYVQNSGQNEWLRN